MRFVEGFKGFAVLARDFEANLGIAARTKVGVYFPIFFRNECPDLALTLHHQLHSNRLNTASGEPSGDLGPEQR